MPRKGPGSGRAGGGCQKEAEEQPGQKQDGSVGDDERRNPEHDEASGDASQAAHQHDQRSAPRELRGRGIPPDLGQQRRDPVAQTQHRSV